MVEELDLFKKTMSNAVFKNTPITILLNKKDLFEDLVKNKIPLNTAFPEYDGELFSPQFSRKRRLIAGFALFFSLSGGDDTMSNINYIAEEFQDRLSLAGKEVTPLPLSFFVDMFPDSPPF